MGILSVGFIVTCIFVAIMGLTGALTLFVKAENIERSYLVGGFTLCTTILAVILLDHTYRIGLENDAWMMVLVWLLAVSGFVLGRVMDYLLGPRSDGAIDDPTLGADLAD